MAGKKQPFMRFETREDFEKWFEEIYNDGKEHGFKEGRITALSYFIGTMNDRFEDDEIRMASHESENRRIAEWKKQEEFIKMRVEYELKKKLEESSKDD